MRPLQKPIEVHCARVGGCSRALSFHMVKAREGPLSPKVREIYNEGERLERAVVKELKERGYSPVKGKQLSTSLKFEGKVVKFFGTPDFIVKYRGERVPLEMKSMNRSRFFRLPKKFEEWNDNLKFKYSYQLRGYLYLCESDVIIFAGKEKTKKGESDGRLKEVIVPTTDKGLPSWKDFRARIERSLKVFDGYEVLPEGYEKCDWCAFNYMCFTTSIQKLLKRKPNKLKDIVLDDKNFINIMNAQHARVLEGKEILEAAQSKYVWFYDLVKLKYQILKKDFSEVVKGG